MSEFTGERLIPGLVDDDLLNEHLARYRFASRLSTKGAAVLDAGCGTGYGSAEFTDASSVVAVDVSAVALRHAAQHFARPGLRFVQAGCEALPFAAESFDLVTAFEVIEHLDRWDLLLAEAHRVLRPEGMLIVSTPNKAYYTKSRGDAGPNPYHVHEFEFSEFESALRAVFPQVRIWTQNHSEAIVFAPAAPVAAELEASGDAAPESASFFVAVCSRVPIAANHVFAYVPRSANSLRERERHIAKLEGELLKKDAWLAQALESQAALQRAHEQTLAELKERNRWAERLNDELAAGAATIRDLQNEANQRAAWIANLHAEIARANAEIVRLQGHAAELESELVRRTDWARSLEADLTARTEHIKLQQAQIEAHEEHLERQAQLLERNNAELAAQARRIHDLLEERTAVANSKWLRLGRKLNMGPSL